MPHTQNLRLATRSSPLAMQQAQIIAQALTNYHPNLSVQIIGMTTTGDKQLETPLAQMGGKGLFIKELEHALLNNKADIAVHSMKDIPTELAPDLMLATIYIRENPCDVFISNHYQKFEDMPSGACIGTSSLRRQCQLLSLRPDLQVLNLRGNLQSRLKKLDAGQFDAIILAAAGLERLSLQSRIRQYFSPHQFIPAVGQGALGIECRKGDESILSLLVPLDHLPTRYCVTAERAFNQALQGGCQVPIAAYAQLMSAMNEKNRACHPELRGCHAELKGHHPEQSEGSHEKLFLSGLVGKPDGSIMIRATIEGFSHKAEDLGRQLADRINDYNVQKILGEIQR